MADEIVNRVSQSKLVLFDLEELYPAGERVEIDLTQWLENGLVLREKPFREAVKGYDWAQFRDKFVALRKSTDVIIPVWAYMLITTALQPFAKRVIVGNLADLETAIFQSVLEDLDVSAYKGKPLIIKGCSRIAVPETAYVQAVEKLRPVARSIQFGEACSSVPLYKQK